MADRGIATVQVGDDFEWAARSEYWRNYEPKKIGRGAAKKFKYREPLILCGHGIRINVDHRTLLIRNGFTHYPQRCEEIRYFPGDANLPDRIVILDGNGGISLDALNWLTDQQITLVQLDWRGQVSFVGGNSGYSANPKLVERQLIIRGNYKSVEIARWLILEKIAASIKAITEVFPESENRKIAISRLNKWLGQIKQLGKSASIPRIMGLEGAAAAAYFQTWQGLPIKWSGSKRKPIPNSWREIGPRTMGWRKTGQNARHPVNAMLNYGYGILAAELRTAVVSAGFDPGIGIMHGTKHNRIPLVYDVMEPLRPIVDAAILKFVLGHEFSPGDFTINNWGGCRINPQMATQIVKQIQMGPGIRSVREAIERLISERRQ